MWSKLTALFTRSKNHLEEVIPSHVDGGKRLLPRTKWILLSIVSLVIGLLVLGIMTSVHHHQANLTQEEDENTAQIGAIPAPQPPPTLPPVQSLTGENPMQNNHQDNQIIPFPPRKNKNSQPELNEHQKWLRDHHYQKEEKNLATLERALEAPLMNSFSSVHADNLSPSWQNVQNNPSISIRKVKDNDNAQDQFIYQNAQQNDGDVLAETWHRVPGPHEIMAGSILPASLLTAINSDLPGVLTAQINQNVFDTLHPDVMLIPQGSKLIGRYDHAISYGQSRVLITWNRLIFPDGSNLNLAGMLGVDTNGESGLIDLTDNHYGRIFGSAVFISILGVGAQLSQPQNTSILNAPSTGQQASAATANELNMVGSQLLQKNLNIAPTLEIRAGTEFNVLVNKSILLPPYPHE